MNFTSEVPLPWQFIHLNHVLPYFIGVNDINHCVLNALNKLKSESLVQYVRLLQWRI